MTNGDKIRSMSDKELAEWIQNALSPDKCPPKRENEPCSFDDECWKCYFDWLTREET